MKRGVVLLIAVLMWAVPVFAQIKLPGVPANLKFSPEGHDAQGATPRTRGGFTVLVNLGIGVQTDTGLDESATGLAGANLGIGGFVTEKLAVLGRISGTNVFYDLGGFGEIQQVSGVAGATLQYWATDRLVIEGGGGVGFWTAEGESQRGFGLIVGASGVVFNRGKHNLLVGVEYAPAFTDSGTVHNLGVTFGYQFHLR